MGKIPVNNIASVGIIYRASDPRQIFGEIKDDGYPIKLGRRKFCWIGGNWIGEPAKSDRGALDTFRRELDEEISFNRPIRSSKEYALIGIANQETFAPTAMDIQPTPLDIEALRELKSTVSATCQAFGMFCNVVSKEALDKADPENKRDGFTSLVCYWKAALGEASWGKLCELQKKFGNLSSESVTIVTSAEEISQSGMKGLFGHDQVLQSFLKDEGYNAEASLIPLEDGIQSLRQDWVLSTYEACLELYDVAKKPG